MAIPPERLAQLRKELWGPRHQELIDEIDRLTRKLAEARAACAEMRKDVEDARDLYDSCGKIEIGDKDRGYYEEKAAVCANLVSRWQGNPGQPLLADYDRLRRLEAAVGNDELRTNVALTAALKGMEPLDVADLYRAVLLAAMKGETK